MITVEQLKSMPDGTVIRCSSRRYVLHRSPSNPHDCWFIGPKNHGNNGSRIVRRAYDGSSNIPPDVSSLANCVIDCKNKGDE